VVLELSDVSWMVETQNSPRVTLHFFLVPRALGPHSKARVLRRLSVQLYQRQPDVFDVQLLCQMRLNSVSFHSQNKPTAKGPLQQPPCRKETEADVKWWSQDEASLYLPSTPTLSLK
jgi:hypothetical protein